MVYRVEEQSSIAKRRSGEGCEDRIFLSADYAAVIDGATTKTGRDYGGLSEGAFVAEACMAALGAMPAGLQGADLIARISAHVAAALEADGQGGPRPCAVLAVYSAARRSVTRVGDVTVVIGGVGAPVEKELDRISAEARAAFAGLLMALGEASEADLIAHDRARDFIFPILERQHVFQNVEREDGLGFGVIDGARVPEAFIEVMPAEGEIILASDGYPEVMGSLAATEAALASALAEDPLCLHRVRMTKGVYSEAQVSFDDRTYLRLLA